LQFADLSSGTTIEIIHESSGWFQFCALEGGKQQLIAAGTGNVIECCRWYAPGLLEQMKKNPSVSANLKPEGHVFGKWKLLNIGKSIVLSNVHDGKTQIHLNDNGFTYVNCGLNEAIVLDGTRGKFERLPVSTGQWCSV